jgi:prolipoprotein diacylglyceryltransferase
VLLLLWLARRWTIRPPGLFCLYVVFYCFGRFFEELLRVDPAHEFAGLRLNAWVSIVCFVVAAVAFWRVQWHGEDGLPRVRGRRKPVTPTGPKMVIPRGRVR